MIYASCAAPGAVQVERDLPQVPVTIARTVPVPPLTVDQDSRVAIKACEAGLETANKRIIGFRKWYQGVRTTYNPKAQSQ